MFHLQSGVHLHEVKVMLGIHYELNSTYREHSLNVRTLCVQCDLVLRTIIMLMCLTCSYIVDSLSCFDCCFSKFPSHLRTNTRLGGKKENKRKYTVSVHQRINVQIHQGFSAFRSGITSPEKEMISKSGFT